MEKKIENAISEVLKENGFELLGVKLGEENGEKTLFITIDKENISSDDCVIGTKLISPIIDELDIDLEDYILDVGSKGE